MDNITLTAVTFAGVAVFGAVLSILSSLALRRSRSGRMAFVLAGFLLVTIQGALVAVALTLGGWTNGDLLLVSAGFEASLLAVLFAATLTR